MNAGVRLLGKDRADETEPGVESHEPEPLDEHPHSVYEVVTRQMLEQVKADIAEVKGRVNALIWTVTGAMLLELVMRVLK